MNIPSIGPTERLFSPQTVCVWVSGVHAARALKKGIPDTYAEVIALARDSGVPGDDWKKVGQANFTKLAAGMKKRYGLVGQVIEGAAAAQAAVLAQSAAGRIVTCLAGNQNNLTPHWQNTNIGHAITALYNSGTTGLQLDPLAPAGYNGDPFPPAELAKFCTAALIFKDEEELTHDMPVLKTYSAAKIGLAGAPLINGLVPVYDAPSTKGTLIYALTPGGGYVMAVGTVGVPGDEWYTFWDASKGKWLYVNYTNVAIRIPLEDPADARASGIKAAQDAVIAVK